MNESGRCHDCAQDLDAERKLSSALAEQERLRDVLQSERAARLAAEQTVTCVAAEAATMRAALEERLDAIDASAARAKADGGNFELIAHGMSVAVEAVRITLPAREETDGCESTGCCHGAKEGQ